MSFVMGRAPEELFEKLVLALIFGTVAAASLWFAFPLLLVAIPVALVSLRLGLRASLVGAALSLAIAAWSLSPDPTARFVAYLTLQETAGKAALDWYLDRTPFALAAYARSAAPFALSWGPLVGVLAAVGVFSLRGRNEVKRSDRRPLHLVSADLLAKFKGEREAQSVDGFSARGRLTAITALPKQGKTYAWMGLLKARQEGGTWFGRRCAPGKTCVLTEEDRGTFSRKVKDFGIRGSTLLTIHAPEVSDGWFGPDAWDTFIFDAARRARRAGCDTLCVDTGTTWCPWMFRGPEAMSSCLRTFKRACVKHRLAGVMVLHNRKAGSTLGAVVEMLGTIAGSAAYDVVAGFEREKATGECTLTVDGRLGEWECTARLEHGRYVPVAEASVAEASPVPVPARLVGVLDAFRRAGAAGLTMGGAQEVTRLPEATLRRYVLALAERGQLVREGAGVSGNPHYWRAADLPPAAPTADPEYTRYLQSVEWKRKCRLVLERAEMRCEAEECGEAAAPGDTLEVHHLPEAYALIPDEPLELLVAMCAGCHRRAHAR